MSLNKIGNVLVTGGEDATIFIYKVSLGTNKYNFLTPIGYIAVPGIITYLTWHDKYVRSFIKIYQFFINFFNIGYCYISRLHLWRFCSSRSPHPTATLYNNHLHTKT